MKPNSFVVTLDQQAKASSNDFPTLTRYGIYVISRGDKILRVGESGSGKSRLSKGFRDPLRRKLRGKDRKNYIAYSWRTTYAGEKLNVDYFELKDNRFTDNHFRRALEAEITFQFRLARKQWPQEMSEVHFLERHRTDPLLVQTATGILGFFGVRYDTTT